MVQHSNHPGLLHCQGHRYQTPTDHDLENRSSSEENSRTTRPAFVSTFQPVTTTPGSAAALTSDCIAPQVVAAGSDTPLETVSKIALVTSSDAGRVDPHCIVECADNTENQKEG